MVVGCIWRKPVSTRAIAHWWFHLTQWIIHVQYWRQSATSWCEYTEIQCQQQPPPRYILGTYLLYSIFNLFLLFTAIPSKTHRIHRCQHAIDNVGMSKHRLLPYYAYYHNWHTLTFTAPDSSSDERCFLKVLIVLKLTQLAGSIFQLSITLLEDKHSS